MGHASPLLVAKSATPEMYVRQQVASTFSISPLTVFCIFAIRAFSALTLENFYLQIPMEKSEYVRIKLSDIPPEFIGEYNLTLSVQNGWIYFETLQGCYGLPQSGRLANDLLHTRLEKAVYYKAATTPVLWIHKWRPI